jgi:K+-transporting ATPase ATPase B chain
VTITVLVALLVCLAPTTIGALLSAIGIAGMSRLSQANVVAMSGRAVEAAGDVDVLLLDKTGTITLGNRQATEFIPCDGVSAEEFADAAQLSSLADETPEGRSIVVLAKRKFELRGRDVEKLGARFVPFSAHTRMSGVDLEGRRIRKGAAEAIEAFVGGQGGSVPQKVRATVQTIAREGGTPLVVADGPRVLGTILLKDIVKGGLKERFTDRDDYGRQPDDGGGHRGRGGRGRFPCRGDARKQAQAHPRIPGQGAPGGHDRRRHQRRPRLGAS